MRILLTDLNTFIENTANEIRTAITALADDGVFVEQEITIEFTNLELVSSAPSLKTLAGLF